MGLGLKAKNRRGPTVQVDYLIHVQEIKPWPPTQSLKNVRSVLIQWENGDRNSGNTSSVAPSVKDGKIEFNESFKLPVTFSRDMTAKSGDSDVFQKNLLEFNLYEPRRDKTVKGQLLGTAIVDLSDFAVVKEITSVHASLNCTRSFRNATQPVLYIKIEPVDKSRSGSSSKASLGKEASLERNGSGSISALMKEEYADEAEIASFTDDDVSSHSSVTASSALESNGASPARNKENGSVIRPAAQPNENRKSTSSRSTSVDLSSETGSPNNAPSSLRNISVETSESNPTNIVTHGAKSSTSYVTREISPGFHQEGGNLTGGRNSQLKSGEDMSNSISNKAALVPVDEKLDSANGALARASGGNEGKHELPRSDSMLFVDANDSYDDSISDTEKHEENGEPRHSIGSEMSDGFSPDLIRRQVSGCDAAFSKDRPRHVKSVRSSMDSAASNGSVVGLRSAVSKEAKVYTTERRNAASDGKVPELEQRIKMLEGELKEAAAIEASLYSVVAEHGSSINKVHTPARRLSRLYLQGGKGIRKASAARSAVSGLVVVAKSCGNDVPRLMFWLSNCVMVRAIIIQAFSENQLPVSAGPSLDGKGINKKSPTLKWKTLASDRKGNRRAGHESLVDWEDPHALTSALEKVESWIFSRIIESIWWQTLIPHMQSSAAKAFDKILDSGSKKYYRRNSSSGDQEQVNLSLELWKKAFKDARERLCPVRAGGHECGCLPVLSKLIMEQCVARLDVAMFNALLRESADHIPTDPVSDPISDARVLPIFAGKSSFGAGAQLKNAIGNWSRWLTDLFGMDDDDDDDGDPLEGDDDEQMYEVGDGDERRKHDKSFRSFHLLKSLSDLMMLPKDMLLSDSIRKEVCPTFGLQLIRRVLNNFVPDEFCPDPIPVAVFEALDTEESLEDEDSSMTNFPCTAPAVIYSPPSASSLTNIILGDIGSRSELRRSGSSVLRKSNTSDDELDELDSPLNSIAGESLMTSPAARMKGKQNGNENAVRYKLLREVWISSE